jgi:hypothetical protein
MSAKPAGTSGRSSSTCGTASRSTLASTCATELPENGATPTTSSNSTQPSAQMSARASTVLADTSCSGAMYAGDPSSAAVLVLAASPGPFGAILDTPKSSTFTHGEPSARRTTNRLAGLRSRCTMPAAWASAIASQAWPM